MYVYLGYFENKNIHITIHHMEQYNEKLINKTGEKTVKLKIDRIYDKLQEKEDYEVTVDDEEVYTGKYKSGIELNIAPGKHTLYTGSISKLGIKSFEVPENCKAVYIDVEAVRKNLIYNIEVSIRIEQ